jgi:hypothetical protein
VELCEWIKVCACSYRVDLWRSFCRQSTLTKSNMIFHFYFVSKLSKFRCRKMKRGQMILKVHSGDFRFDDSHVFASTIMWAKKKRFYSILTILRFTVSSNVIQWFYFWARQQRAFFDMLWRGLISNYKIRIQSHVRLDHHLQTRYWRKRKTWNGKRSREEYFVVFFSVKYSEALGRGANVSRWLCNFLYGFLAQPVCVFIELISRY